MLLLWDHWNVEHINAHGVSPHEAQEVIDGAKRPFPKARGNGKYQVLGQTGVGRFLQVIYVYRNSDTITLDQIDLLDRLELLETGKAAYVIHARELRQGESRRLRKQ